MRHEIARVIHQVDRRLAILHAHMYVQTKNQIRSRHQLQIFDNILVALVRINFLRSPIGKWMRSRRRQSQPDESGLEWAWEQRTR